MGAPPPCHQRTSIANIVSCRLKHRSAGVASPCSTSVVGGALVAQRDSATEIVLPRVWLEQACTHHTHFNACPHL